MLHEPAKVLGQLVPDAGVTNGGEGLALLSEFNALGSGAAFVSHVMTPRIVVSLGGIQSSDLLVGLGLSGVASHEHPVGVLDDTEVGTVGMGLGD